MYKYVHIDVLTLTYVSEYISQYSTYGIDFGARAGGSHLQHHRIDSFSAIVLILAAGLYHELDSLQLVGDRWQVSDRSQWSMVSTGCTYVWTGRD